jgi:ABC-type transport system involved in multi-copper enzyme maturation permease subunit
MPAAFRGELFKLVRRGSIWFTIGMLLVLAIALGYLVTYLVATHPPTGTRARIEGADFAALRNGLYPSSLVSKTLTQWTNFGGVVALILGVLVQGSEYGWGTVKTMYIQRPGRLSMLEGKVAALLLLVLVMVLALFAVDAASSSVIALIDGKSSAFPAVADIAKAIGATWLIFGMWAMFGFGLATLFRQAAMAIGLGLAYGLVIEGIVFGLLGRLGSDLVKQIHIWLPIANAGYLSQSFGRSAGFAAGPPAPAPDADATHAVAVLAIYVIGFVILSAALIRQRDVT